MLDLLAIDRFSSSVLFFYIVQLFLNHATITPLIISAYFLGAIFSTKLWEYNLIRGRPKVWILASAILPTTLFCCLALSKTRDVSAWAIVCFICGCLKLEIPCSVIMFSKGVNFAIQPCMFVMDSCAYLVIIQLMTFPGAAAYLFSAAFLLQTGLCIHHVLRIDLIPAIPVFLPQPRELDPLFTSIKGLVEFNSFAQYSILTYSVVFIFERSGYAIALYAFLGGAAVTLLGYNQIRTEKVAVYLGYSASAYFLCAILSCILFASRASFVYHELILAFAVLVSAITTNYPVLLLNELKIGIHTQTSEHLQIQFVSRTVAMIVTWTMLSVQFIAPYIIISFSLLSVVSHYQDSYLLKLNSQK